MIYGSSRDEEERRKKKTDGDYRSLGRSRTASELPTNPTAAAPGSNDKDSAPPRPRETDPLILPKNGLRAGGLGLLTIRSRRTARKSPTVLPAAQSTTRMDASQSHQDDAATSGPHYYESMEDHHPTPTDEQEESRRSVAAVVEEEEDGVERQRQALSPPTVVRPTTRTGNNAVGPTATETSSASSSAEIITLNTQQQADVRSSERAAAVDDQPLLPHSMSAGALELNQRRRQQQQQQQQQQRRSLFSQNPVPSASASFPPPPSSFRQELPMHNASPLVAGQSSLSSSQRKQPPTTTYGTSSQASHNNNNHPPARGTGGLDKAHPEQQRPQASGVASASTSGEPARQGGAASHRSGRFSSRRTGSGGSDNSGGSNDYNNQDYQSRYNYQNDEDDEHSYPSNSHVASPILEIPEEIYQIRKAALQVLKPLTKTWVVMSVGFALAVLFGTSRWTRLMPGLPFWFILLPAWLSHAGLLFLHVQSAQNLSVFIASANEVRQRGDSRDHINRTEYLPLLQRSLKFGLKTGLLSFIMFLFEILIYVRMAKSSISLSVTFIPLWLLVAAGLTDGIVCKTQHWLRVSCWLLLLAAMILVVLKVDYHIENLRWRTVFCPIIVVLSIASGTLIYIVYGHQVGYYRLTESQLTAGNLYSLAALICMVLLIMLGEVIPLSRPVEIESRLFVVILAPLVIALVGMGAWVVSRDEYARLLLYGGQAAVHPMKLKWEANGWTCVQGRGVVTIPMFGEVSFQPLERKPASPQPADRAVELMTCCSGVSCYPYEQDDEEAVALTIPHHYLDPLHSRGPYHQVYRGL